MTVAQLRRTVTTQEFTGWLAFYAIRAEDQKAQAEARAREGRQGGRRR